MGKDESPRPDRATPRTTFVDVFQHTVAICTALVPLPAFAIVLLVGGNDLLDAGALVATGIAIPVIALGVSWFRYQRGATGFPRRQPVQPGDRVGEWLVLDRLHSEVQPASTYLVRRHDEYGVLKVSYHRADDQDTRARAAREAEYLGRVDARHVVAKLDSASTPAATYLVTRYLGRQTLWDRRQAGPLPDAELYSIAAGSLAGLAALHEAGIAHRDLTPLNVMVDANGAATIIDLGIARADATTQMTTTRSRIFTVGYRAPEQFAGRSEPKSDVFVWATTMYYLATGVEAFTGDEAEVQAHILSAPPDLSACPRWLQPALRASFTRSPAQRPSAADVLALLDSASQAAWPVRIPTTPTPPRTTRVPSWVSPSAVLTAMVLALLTMFLLYEKSNLAEVGPAADPGENPSSTTAGTSPPSTRTSTEPDSTTSSASSTTTTSSAGPVAEFVGIWHGGSLGSDGEVPVVFTIDNGVAAREGDPVGGWTYLLCTGPLRLVSATPTVLVLTPVETQADCGFGGRATLTRSGDSAAYDWESDDGAATRSGTFVRSARITLDDPGWPTGSNEAGNAFYANLGVCMTGGSGCSESGQTPTWTACTTDELCIAGGDASVVDVWRNLTWVLEIPQSVPNTAVALLGVGFTEAQVVDLLDP